MKAYTSAEHTEVMLLQTGSKKAATKAASMCCQVAGTGIVGWWLDDNSDKIAAVLSGGEQPNQHAMISYCVMLL